MSGDITIESKRLVNKLLEANKRDSWKWAFRSSAMPACQIQQIWFEMDRKLGELPGRKQTYFGDFFMDVGTAVHATTQRWLSRMGVLYGNWMCENPKCECFEFDKYGELKPVTIEKFGPQRCPSCRRELTYSEFSFRDLPTGHCDGIIKLGDLTPGDMDFVLLEIKTSSDKKIEEEFKPNGIPFSYKLQTSLYTHKLRERGYNIVGVLFLFIPRDMPRGMWPYWFKPKRVKRIHDSIVKSYEEAQAALESRQFEGITGICTTTEEYNHCPYAANCFSPIASKLFLEKYIPFYDLDPRNALTVKLPIFPSGC